MRLLKWVAMMAGGLLAVSAQAGIQSSVRVAKIDPQRTFGEVRFTNLGAEMVELEFDGVPWGLRTQASGYQLLAYPPVTRMAAGETQTIRLLVRGPNGSAAPPPAFFRLHYRYRSVDAPEVQATPPPQGLAGRISMKTAVSMPVVYAPRDAAPKPVVQGQRNAAGQLEAVVIANQGDQILRVTHFHHNGQRHALDLTILPGEAAQLQTQGREPPFRFVARDIPDFVFPSGALRCGPQCRGS